MALVNPSRLSSQFIDPAHPERVDYLQGSWRSLEAIFRFSIFGAIILTFLSSELSLFLRNTFIIMVLSEIGVLLSSIMVAYGFSRFEFQAGGGFSSC